MAAIELLIFNSIPLFQKHASNSPDRVDLRDDLKDIFFVLHVFLGFVRPNIKIERGGEWRPSQAELLDQPAII